MVTAQLPGRTAILSELAQRRELPTVPELRQFWSAMVTEVAESGKVVRFNAPVERTNGEKEDLEVVRGRGFQCSLRWCVPGLGYPQKPGKLH